MYDLSLSAEVVNSITEDCTSNTERVRLHLSIFEITVANDARNPSNMRKGPLTLIGMWEFGVFVLTSEHNYRITRPADSLTYNVLVLDQGANAELHDLLGTGSTDRWQSSTLTLKNIVRMAISVSDIPIGKEQCANALPPRSCLDFLKDRRSLLRRIGQRSK